MTILTYDQKKNKHVAAGEFNNYIYRRKVKPSHYMYTLKAYGMSEDVVKTLTHLDCQMVELISKKKILRSMFIDWLRAPLKDYGHGKQHFLPVDSMVEFKQGSI